MKGYDLLNNTMTHEALQSLIDRSLFADLGYLDGDGRPAIRRVFCVWHRGPGGHLISTNTSSRHVKLLSEHPEACLYFADSETFEGVCLTGRAVPTRDRALRELLWNDGDEKYYPDGVDDPDYCVIEFTADHAEYYRYDGKGALDAEALARLSAGKAWENGYARHNSSTSSK